MTQAICKPNWINGRDSPPRAGVANVNLGTFGSEPHMPFGGFGASGNGTREPRVEVLDVYSERNNISFIARSDLI